MGKEICVKVRELIVKYYKEKKSLREIGELVGHPKSSIQTIIRKYNHTNSVENKPRSGRPPKLTPRAKRKILLDVQENPRITAIEIAKTLKNQDIASVHPETVRHLLRSNGIHNRVPRKKPFISKINMEKRVEFAKKYIDAYEDFWANVLFSDESKFNLFGYDGKQKVWRRNNEALLPKNLLPTVKHGGGSIMVWGCMSAAGVGNLTFIDINMDRMVYLDILKDNLKQSASKLGLTAGWYFQQDNDPKHTAGVVKEWLLYNVPHNFIPHPSHRI